MTPLAVALPGDDDQVRAAHARALAALPGRFRVVGEREPADVHLVSCAAAGWAQQATAALAGGRMLVLAGPIAADAAALSQLAAAAREGGSLVTVAQPYAADPAWCAAMTALRATTATVLDSVVTVADRRDLDRALLAQVDALRPLLDPVATTLTMRRGNDHYVLSGSSGACAVSLAGVVAAAGTQELRVDLVGAATRWQARIPGGRTAAAATMTRNDADGEHSSRPRFGGALRAGWIGVHQSALASSSGVEGLDGVLADITLLATAR